ncbi:MAG: SusC/RagA family TonB-linked outer membrane protein [Cyclobacteriaceae bacterium]
MIETLLKKRDSLRLFRVFLLLLLFLVSAPEAWAQYAVSGKVLSAEDGSPMPGVNILVKGTSTGTISDAQGSFTLTVPAAETTLVFSFVGFSTQEVQLNGRSSIEVTLATDATQLTEVVVTALGIEKSKGSLGYAVQDVKGTDLIKAREPNPVNSLTGKVAGLTIAQSAELLGAPNVFLRGKRPLFVVDGVPIQSDTWNISPDDIESITVLKGPNASALYGSRGQYGAIQITTKNGTKDKRGFAVEFNSSFMVDNGFLTIPKVQDKYGPGDHGRYAFGDGKGGGLYDSDYDIWGPPLDIGLMLPQYDGVYDPDNTYTIDNTILPNLSSPYETHIIPTPWVSRGKNNLERFLQNGILSTNNIAVSANGDKYNLRFSTSYNYQRGIVPNTQLNTNNFNVSAGYDFSPKVRFETSLNYNKQFTDNFPDVVYGPNSMIYNIILWGGADWDVNDMRNYWQPGKEGLQQIYAEYTRYNNPWFMAKEWLRGHYKTDVYGHLALKWQISNAFDLMARTQINSYNIFRDEKFPYSGTTYGREQGKGDYREDHRALFENNTDVLITYQKEVTDFDIRASVGGNLRNFNYRSSYTTTDYLNVPGLYAFNNTLNPLRAFNFYAPLAVYSAYGFADVGYRKFLYLSLTGRVDKNSTLPLANDAYFYPSASLSFIPTQLLNLPEPISYIKIRSSYAKVGGGLTSSFIGPIPSVSITGNPLGYGSTYLSPYDGPSYQNAAVYSTPLVYNNQPAGYYSDVLTNPGLKPEFSSSMEAGLESRFFNNRVGVEFTYFNSLDGPKIYSLPLSETSGYTSALVNGIKTRRKGVEIVLTGRPLNNANGLTWDVTANWSTFTEVLAEIYPGVDRLPASRFNPSVNGFNSYLKVGDRVDRYYAYTFYKDPNGNLINDNTGKPIRNPIPQFLGNLNPDWSWAFINKFSYRNFVATVQIDGRVGGVLVNYVQRQTFRGGRHIETVKGEMGEARFQDFLGVKSYVGPGVKITGGTIETDPTGKITNYDELTFAPNDIPEYLQDYISRYYRDEEANLMSRSYAKLREVTVGYTIPKRMLERTFINQATISLVGRNLLYWAEKKDVDIDQFGGYEGYSGLQSPTLRRYGININLTF